MRIYLFLFFLSGLVGLNGQSYWSQDNVPVNVMRSADAIYMPNRYTSFSLDLNTINLELQNAVEAPFSSGRHIKIQLPMPNGEVQTFLTYEAPVMEPGLSAKYPAIKTYKGISEDGKSIARFGTDKRGFHASIRTREGEIYVDQVSRTGGQHYVSYYVKDHGEPMDAHITSCGTDHASASGLREPIGPANRNDNVELHVYRFALACTGVWGRLRGTKEAALADMVISVNRLNQIYENEAAFRLVLIEENDRLIHLDPATDGYTQENLGRELLRQNTARINTLLGGNGGYELGHVYTRSCNDVGGVASLGSMCSSNKGAGVTCHYTNLLYITVQVAAHEIGHQLSARHTFNNCSDSNGDNSNASFGNDMEPGSGSTIMSYGGLCGQNNVQGNNDDYYNNASLREIYNHTRTSGGAAFNCAERIVTDNFAPEVNIPLEDGFHIPMLTFFELTGEASDENGDNLTYNWEQADAGNNTCGLGAPTGSCPLFRSFTAKDVPYRFFPREQRILGGATDESEVLPFYKRDLRFAFTVRDNNPEAGIASWDFVEFHVDDTAGPFKVLTPSAGEEYEIGQIMPVTWDVANTDNALVNCQFVDIYLSYRNALHPSDPDLVLIEESVPNTGLANVVIPNVEANDLVKVLIRGHNNIFFDISDLHFKIKEATNPIPYFSMNTNNDNICLPGNSVVNLSTDAIGGYTGNVSFEAVDLPSGVTATFSSNVVEVGAELTVTFDVDASLPTGSYNWGVRSISDNQDTIYRAFFVDVISTDFDDLASVSPAEGLKNEPGLPIFRWSSSFNATGYVFELASNPSFSAESLLYQETLVDTFFVTPDFLEKSSVYYWRVKALNECGEGEYTFTRSLGTVNQACGEFTSFDTPVNITQSSSVSVSGRTNVTSEGIISDLNILGFKVNHENFKDLTGELRSPSGTEVTVFTNSCNKRYNSNIAFDDDSNNFFNCQNGVTIFRPHGELADFNGENPFGIWEFTLTDINPGSGGTFESYTIEICGAISTNAPYIVNNEVVQIQPFNNPRISKDKLLINDDDNSPSELLYTLVYTPQNGELLWGGSPMHIGDQFTQQDIDDSHISYTNTKDASEDSFYFTVEDGNGGWIEITKFTIEIDSSFPSATNDPDLLDEVKIFPNPTKDFIYVSLSNKASRLSQLQVLDIHGRLIAQQKVQEGLHQVNLANMNSGVYLIKVSDGRNSVIKRFVLQ